VNFNELITVIKQAVSARQATGSLVLAMQSCKHRHLKIQINIESKLDTPTKGQLFGFSILQAVCWRLKGCSYKSDEDCAEVLEYGDKHYPIALLQTAANFVDYGRNGESTVLEARERLLETLKLEETTRTQQHNSICMALNGRRQTASQKIVEIVAELKRSGRLVRQLGWLLKPDAQISASRRA